MGYSQEDRAGEHEMAGHTPQLAGSSAGSRARARRPSPCRCPPPSHPRRATCETKRYTVKILVLSNERSMRQLNGHISFESMHKKRVRVEVDASRNMQSKNSTSIKPTGFRCPRRGTPSRRTRAPSAARQCWSQSPAASAAAAWAT